MQYQYQGEMTERNRKAFERMVKVGMKSRVSGGAFYAIEELVKNLYEVQVYQKGRVVRTFHAKKMENSNVRG